jgi:hypothetical protein
VYTVRLTVDGKAHAENVVVTSDPRSPVNLAALRAEDALIRKLNAWERLAWDAFKQVDTMRAQLRAMTPSDSASEAAKAIRAFIAKLDSLGGAPRCRAAVLVAAASVVVAAMLAPRLCS